MHLFKKEYKSTFIFLTYTVSVFLISLISLLQLIMTVSLVFLLGWSIFMHTKLLDFGKQLGKFFWNFLDRKTYKIGFIQLLIYARQLANIITAVDPIVASKSMKFWVISTAWIGSQHKANAVTKLMIIRVTCRLARMLLRCRCKDIRVRRRKCLTSDPYSIQIRVSGKT